MGDDEFVVKCVKPSNQQDENNPISGVQTAYDIMIENGFHLIWIEAEDCLKVEQKERDCVYIIDSFHGQAFDHLSSVGCRIFGPQCVLSCLNLKLGIPKTRVPIYSLAMKDLVITCTSLEKKTREDVMCKVQWMAGEVRKDLTDSVTHLVAGEVGSKKYVVAGNLGKHIMSPEWVEEVWNKGKHKYLHGTDEQFQKYKCPIFKNMVVTVSGLDIEKREQVKSLVEAEGGSYSGEMRVNECTHVIIKEPKGQKYECARRYKIQIVSLKWLTDSVEKGYCQDEENYRLLQSSQRPQLSTSTPDKDKNGKGQRLSSMGDISSISHLSDLSMVNETTMGNVTRLSTDEQDVLLDLNLNHFPADLFLDGCKIYLSGFRGPHLEKLRKIINLGGATRLNQITDSLTHVIIGEKLHADITALKEASFRPHVVTTAWLIDSLKQGKIQKENKYTCVELPPLPNLYPKPKLSRSSVEKSADVTVSNQTDNEDREMANLLSQYMHQEADQTLQPVDPPTLTGADVDNQTATEHTDVDIQTTTQQTEPAPEEGFFGGKKFVFFGFEDDQQQELRFYIEQNGGKVISGPCREVCDFAVVPIGGYPVTATVSEVVTNAWLQMCLEEGGVLPVESNPLFQPLEILDESSPLNGCVLSISGFAGTERDCLMHIAEVLGARCQEYFLRKANKGLAASTHLLTKEAEGSKYNAAKKWKLHAVSKDWLFACARSGERKPEENFLIDRLESSTVDQLSTSSKPTGDKSHRLSTSSKPTGDKIHRLSSSSKPTDDKINRVSTSSKTTGDKTHRLSLAKPIEETTLSRSAEALEEKFEETMRERRIESVNTGCDKLSESNDNNQVDDVFKEDIPPVDITEQILDKENNSSIAQKTNTVKILPVSDTPSKAGRKEKSTELSPPGGSSQKENIHVTPASRPQHGRVKELLACKQQPRTPSTAARLGIDTPNKFLKPGKTYNPNFDLNDFMSAVESPLSTNTPNGKKTSRRRKSSLPLDEALQWNLSQGMKISTTSRVDLQRGETDVQADQHNFSSFTTMDENVGPLRDVVIAVSKKLGTHQAEYNNMAASLGADYRWTYDKSCTHFIFQGRPNDINKEFRTAREHGKLIVSPYWLSMCKEQNAKVDESLFPHNYNPNLTLSVVTSKRETPARSTRKSSRTTTRSLSDDPPKLALTETPKKSKPVEPHTETKSPPPDKTDSVSENKAVMMETGGTLEICEAYNRELKDLMASTKTKKGARRKSRRLNSSGQIDTENSSTESINKSRSSSRIKQSTPQEDRRSSGGKRSRRSSRQSDHGHSEPSQSVQVTWEDETGRLEQERLAAELQRAHSPTQCSEAYQLEFGENAQFSDVDKDDSMEVQLNIKSDQKSKSTELRTPTPEPPTLGFPTAQSNQPNAEPVNFIEETKEVEEVPTLRVFIVSGMQRQERDDYGALVEELGGQMFDGLHYHSSCTHLVVGQPIRNEKFLACVASGKWVLHKSYFEACRQEGRFVEEEVHEWGSEGTKSILSSSSALTVRLAVAAHRWRIRVQENIRANVTCLGAFEGWRVVLSTDKNKEENFKRLLEAGGAHVVATRPPFGSSLDATHAFLDLHKVDFSQSDLENLLKCGVKCLRTEYIAAFLTEDPTPNPEDYCPTEVMAIKASISVPDQAIRKRKSSSTSSTSNKSRKV